MSAYVLYLLSPHFLEQVHVRCIRGEVLEQVKFTESFLPSNSGFLPSHVLLET